MSEILNENQNTIEALMDEQRKFEPSAQFRAQANISSNEVYEESRDFVKFWDEQASKIQWRSTWSKTLDWSNAPFAKWFVDAKLNITESCLDRHLDVNGDKVAYYFEGEPGDTKVITFNDLYHEVNKLANGLKSLGVKKGDRVAIYMGMIPELPVALLATARLGAVHSVIFGGFSAESLRDRINDAGATVLITCDESWRGGNRIPLKEFADAALTATPSIENVVVVQRTMGVIQMTPNRDVYYSDLVANQSDELFATETDSEDPLFILYTSGTTASPKGIVHSSGGYLVGASYTHKNIFDIKDNDVYWCTADIGWVTGHSYVVYGPLANGCSSVLFEGVPNFPDKDRFWEIIEKYKVTQFYTAPTAIRTFMKWGDQYPKSHDLSSLRVIGTVGEPINPEAWIWYNEHIGYDQCPIVDTWWQTETGHIMISPLPGITTTKPSSATVPIPGVTCDIVDDHGKTVPLGGGGYLVITNPWPGMVRTIYGDAERFVEVYWSRFSKPDQNKWVYFAGDGAKRDKDGYYWLLGRVDDVMNISGHRISTLEVESALVDHHSVAEAAVIGRSDATTGQAIVAFVTLRANITGGDELIRELRDHVADKIGKIARPASIVFTDELPKTRSGKIMRRLLRDISEHRQLGDTTTLANADVISDIAKRMANDPTKD